MAFGSGYIRPGNGERILNITNGLVSFTGGNLASAIVNQVSLGTNNRVTNLSSNKLSLTFVLPTGLMKGTVVNSVTLKTLSYNGVVQQSGSPGLAAVASLECFARRRRSRFTQRNLCPHRPHAK